MNSIVSNTPDRPESSRDASARTGELMANKLRLILAAVLAAFTVTMRFTTPEVSPSFFFFTGSTAGFMIMVSLATIAIIKRRLYAPWMSVMSVAFDVAMISFLAYTSTMEEPFRFAGSPAPALYFIAIALAAVRQQPFLSALAGICSAAIFLFLSGYFYLANMAKGSSYLIHDGRALLGLNFLDDVAKGLAMVVTGWIITHVARNLKNSRQHYRDLFENIPDGVMITDGDGKIEMINSRFASMVMMPADEITGRPSSEFLSVKRSTDQAAFPSDMIGDSLSLAAADGSTKQVMTSALSMHTAKDNKTVTSIRDVTDQVRMERQLTHLQQMQSLGELAGGMAHDLNNILGGILGAVELSSRTARKLEPELGRNLKRQLEIINECGGRGRDVIEALLSFSRRSQIEGNTLDLCELLDEVVEICGKTFGGEYVISKRNQFRAAVIEGDDEALTQAMMNICINARDAMPDGGEISFSLDKVRPARSVLARRSDALPGEMYWCIEIVDTGSGIPPGILEKIFDPFFSTKATGDGTGLGLTMAYNTIRSHGGFIDLAGTGEEGTSVKIHLPIRREEPLMGMLSQEAVHE